MGEAARTLRLAAVIGTALALGLMMTGGGFAAAPPASPSADQAATTAEEVEPLAISIATITGVPADVRFALRDLLKKYARTRKLTVVDDDDDQAAVYRLSGRISAVGDVEGTFLIYTWTVSDPAGHKLHRYAGQEKTGGSLADPWMAIRGPMLDEAARDTIDALVDWIRVSGAPRTLQ